MRLRRGIIGTAAMCLVVAALTSGAVTSAKAATAGVALAGGRTLYVGAPGSGRDGCALPGYRSVEHAVDAAHDGDTVFLCGTKPFAEQVFVSKHITLTGSPGASLVAPASASDFAPNTSHRWPARVRTDNLYAPQAILVVTGAKANLTLTGLTIAGPLPGNGGCAVQEIGVFVIGGGTANLSHDTVSDIRDANSSLWSCSGVGYGIEFGRTYWPTSDFSNFPFEDFTGFGQIDHTTVVGYGQNGVYIDAPGTHVTVENSTITGPRVFPYFGMNGIQWSRGATGGIHNNTISGNAVQGSVVDDEVGIYLFGGCGQPLVTHVDIYNNTLIDNDLGLILGNLNADCTAQSRTPTHDQAYSNTIANGAVTNLYGNGDGRGYQAGIVDIGNRDSIHNNAISGDGYAPQNSATAFVLPINLIATHPDVHNNTFDGQRYP